MIDLNKNHPAFDMKMELLALLSTLPAPKTHLMADLALEFRELQALVSKLQTFGVRSRRHGGTSCLYIERKQLKESKEKADHYLDVVYGDVACPA
jgi:hypothetical protein